jgi:hypothetical protein
MRSSVRSIAFLLTSVAAFSAYAGGSPTMETDTETVTSNTASVTDSASSSGESGSSASSSNASTGTSSGLSSNASSNSTANSSSASSSGSSNSNQGSNTGGFDAIEDDPLIVDTSSIMDDDGMGKVSVQWQISAEDEKWMNITGATQQSFTPKQKHVGQRLRVLINYVDGQGNMEVLRSPTSNPVQNVNDKPTGSPILSGTAMEGDALVVDTSTIYDEDGMGLYDVIWQRSSTKTEWETYPGATKEVLRLGQKNVGYSYRAIITYVDRYNTREVLISNVSELVLNVDDPVEGEILLSGDPVEGETLSVKTDNVSDEDGIASLSVSWEYSKDGRNWRALDTQSTTAIKLTQSFVGMQIRAKATVVDTFGVETVIYSKPSNAVKNVNNAPIGSITIRRVGS